MTCTYRPEVGHPFGQRPLVDSTLDLQWRLTGAQESDDDQGDNANDDTDEDQDDDQQAAPDGDDQGDADDDDQDQDDVDELKTRLAEAEQMARTYKRRMQAADVRATKLEAQIRTLRKTDAPKGDDAKPDDESARRIAELEAKVAEQAVRDAFYASDKYTWQDRATALRLLDVSDVRDAGGALDREALDDAQDALAKAHPYLVKQAEKPKPKGDRPTGQQPGTHRRDGKPDSKTLAAKYGALRGRG